MFVVENSGGVEGRFELILPEGIVSVEGATSFAVAPGAQATVRLGQAKLEVTEAGVIFQQGIAEPVRIPVIAMSPEPTPVPLATPVPTPPPPQWVLNEDIHLEKEPPESLRLVFAGVKSGWSNPQLEMQDPSPAVWLPFTPSPPEEAEPGFLAAIYGKIMGVFDRLTTRAGSELLEEAPARNPAQDAWIEVPLGKEDALSGKTWRLTASAGGSPDGRSPVTPPFRIDAEGMTLQAERAQRRPDPVPSLQLPDAQPVAPARSRHAWISRETTRTTALLQLAVACDSGVTDYRLERLATVMTVDPATGKPSLPKVEPIPHEGEARILAVEHAESDGREIAVVTASINGLVPSSRTTWRLVPLAETGELPPTDEFIVETLPAWRFPWQQFWLAIAFILFAVALFARWKSRRPQG